MIKLELNDNVKNVKSYFMFLKWENYALNVPDWNQKNSK